MKISFSFNLYDDEGNIYDKCLMLHIDGNLILKLKDTKDLRNMIEQLEHIEKEIKENY